MLLVVPISHVDLSLAHRLADRILALGGIGDRRILIVSTQRAKEGAEEVAGKLGADLYVLPMENETGWPMACNFIFNSTAEYLYDTGNTEPWYFMEADCTPLKAGWFEALEEAHKNAGTPFFGYKQPTLYTLRDGTIVEDGKHMVGTGIYPADLWQRSILVKFLSDRAWDVYMQHEIAPHCAHTDLIQHNWSTHKYRREGSQIVCEDAKPTKIAFALPVRDNAVVLHGCKDGSLFDVLEGKDSPKPKPAAEVDLAAARAAARLKATKGRKTQ